MYSALITYNAFVTHIHLFQSPNGVTFIATPATPALTTKWQLKPGDIVTFKHRGFWLGNGKPKSPTIYRVRTDKSWDDIVNSFDENKHTATVPVIRKDPSEMRPTRKKGFWARPENRRQFLIDLATSRGMDPFIADTWYGITQKDIELARVR